MRAGPFQRTVPDASCFLSGFPGLFVSWHAEPGQVCMDVLSGSNFSTKLDGNGILFPLISVLICCRTHDKAGKVHAMDSRSVRMLDRSVVGLPERR